MTEPGRCHSGDGPLDPRPDTDALMTSLRTAGAERFDPVRWHYIEVLAERKLAHQGNIRCMLDARLRQAIMAFQGRLEIAQCNARETVARAVDQYPQAAKDLQRHADAGDFKGLHRLVANLKGRAAAAPLGELVRQLEQHAAGNADVRVERHAGSRPELKAIRNHRNTWSKLSVHQQVAQALEQAPKNAGPINSHMLVLRSLALMRDISPDYLNRFISYADTLLCLDQGEKDKPVALKKTQASRAAKK